MQLNRVFQCNPGGRSSTGLRNKKNIKFIYFLWFENLYEIRLIHLFKNCRVLVLLAINCSNNRRKVLVKLKWRYINDVNSSRD